MRILIVSQWYLPEPATGISGLAETLVELGHTVTVLTGFPNYPRGRLYPGYRIRAWQRETINDVKVVRVPLYPSHDESAIRRALNYLTFAVSAACLGRFLIKRVDVVHVYHPPLTACWPGWVLSVLYWVPLTLEIQDLWPDTLSATGMVKNSRTLRVIGWWAQWFYRRARAIRVISNGFGRRLGSIGIDPGKIRVIPNFAEAVPAEMPCADVQRGAVNKGMFTVMFAGNMGLAQGLETVLDAAALLKNHEDIRFALVGDGVDCQRLRKLAEQRYLANVSFWGQKDPSEMPRIYAQADVLLVHLRDDPLFEITVPHKVYTYMANGKPILAAIKGDTADLIRSTGSGVVCPPGEAGPLADEILKMKAMPAEELFRMGKNGQSTVREQFGRERIVRGVEAMLQSVVEVTAAIPRE
jgi:glycosyltransferase involved in cell wall biosynthesis